ncbi:SLBB domain-containing protein [bacterium]|nr:SLBB domain-containing protein [bacterium]MDA7673346.1 SLBB domain-containing protein [Verrucomicrobiales bacterium]MDB4657347.1 SLBB domain-containing protein [Verrucomicrobiales bacterium]MDC0259042.1 SLBB domain-containing protein [Verrucomicrobiales bacterium]MDC0276015.1 SLBB domain-containing protein [Verrucomicrobiales bacterium]
MKHKHKHILGIFALASLFFGKTEVHGQGEQNRTLQPGDEVVITVFGEDKLSTEARIGESGSVELPLIGSVILGGKSVKDATAEITQKLAGGFVVDPKVTLVVTGASMAETMVLGHVRKPGAVELPGDRPINLLTAIAIAGGFDENANKGSVSVRRSVDGKDKVFRLDARKLAADESADPFLIQANDIISVPELMMDSITVMGQVKNPGIVEVPVGDSLDVLTVLATAGGLTEQADSFHIFVRRHENGHTNVHKIDADHLINNAKAKTFRVKAGDVVTIPVRTQETVSVMGEVNKPGLISLPNDKPLTLLDAIAAAGGYTRIANPKRILLKRSIEGEKKVYQINGKRLAGDNDADPVQLLPNDVITVGESFF